MSRRAPIVFVGPSLPAREVGRHLRADVRPPCAQGDVWQALLDRPTAIVLIDGVFESTPSVWHRELLAALEAGVPLFGGASMGALRAVELAPFGMVGVGQIFRWYRDGALVDDSEVALLHASAEHGFVPLTLPLVNVRHAAALAQRSRVLSAGEAEALVHTAGGIFYQSRHWAAVLEAMPSAWGANVRRRFEGWLPSGAEDLKARDAREVLAAAATFLRSGARAPSQGQTPQPSSARRRKLVQRGFRAQPQPSDLALAGLKGALLTALARSLGLTVTREERLSQERAFWRGQGLSAAAQPAALRRLGMDAHDAAALIEDLALEAKVLRHAARLLPDGPSPLEGLARAVRTFAPRRGRTPAGRSRPRDGSGTRARSRRRSPRATSP